MRCDVWLQPKRYYASRQNTGPAHRFLGGGASTKPELRQGERLNLSRRAESAERLIRGCEVQNLLHQRVNRKINLCSFRYWSLRGHTDAVVRNVAVQHREIDFPIGIDVATGHWAAKSVVGLYCFLMSDGNPPFVWPRAEDRYVFLGNRRHLPPIPKSVPQTSQEVPLWIACSLGWPSGNQAVRSGPDRRGRNAWPQQKRGRPPVWSGNRADGGLFTPTDDWPDLGPLHGPWRAVIDALGIRRHSNSSGRLNCRPTECFNQSPAGITVNSAKCETISAGIRQGKQKVLNGSWRVSQTMTKPGPLRAGGQAKTKEKR